MANKRQLKKGIKYACNDLAYACFITECSLNAADEKTFNDMLVKIAELKKHALCNATFSFDKTASEFENKRAYHQAKTKYFKAAYHKLTDEFTQHLQALVDTLNSQLKESNK